MNSIEEMKDGTEDIMLQEENFSWKGAFMKWAGLFLVLLAVIVISLLIYNFQVIIRDFFSLFGFIKPIVYGCVIAYILNPLVNYIGRNLMKLAEKNGKVPSNRIKSLIRGLSIASSMVLMILIIVVLCWLVVPQLVDTISSLITVLPEKARVYYAEIEKTIKTNQFLEKNLRKFALDLTESLQSIIMEKILPWMQSDFLPGINTIAVQFVNGISSFIGILYNFFIGIIVAIYILLGKATFSAQAKKIAYGIFSKKIADVFIYYVKLTHKMFSGFIFGKIVDSAIIGVICLGLMTILNLPYPMLISVIIGVTNIIPFFGPYIGVVPSLLLIVLVNPVQALYFLIMIMILQQVDGNLIGPAILGESTNLSAFWVLFSILFFGGLWGLPGMIVGVPLFAVIYRMTADALNWSLRKKEMSTLTDSYKNLKEIRWSEGREPVYIEYAPEDFENKKKENPIEKIHDTVETLQNKLKRGNKKR